MERGEGGLQWKRETIFELSPQGNHCLHLIIKERGQQVNVVWEGRQARARYTGAFAGHVNTAARGGVVFSRSCCSKSCLALLR